MNNEKHIIGRQTYRNKTIDVMRLFCALLVVMIHTDLFCEYNAYIHLVVQVISRVAVPFFCVTSGYYFAKKMLIINDIYRFNILQEHIIKLIKIYLLISMPYILIVVIRADTFGVALVLEILKKIVLMGTYYHLWFFPTIIISLTILWISLRYNIFKVSLIVSILLYIFICGGDAYYGITTINPILNMIYDSKMYSILRLFMYAYTYVNLGAAISMYGIQIKKYVEQNLKTMFCVNFILLLFEEIVTYGFEINTKLTMAFFYYPTLFLLFLLCLKDPLENKVRDGKICKQLANFVYYFHPLVLFFITRVISNSLILFVGAWIPLLVIGIILFQANNKLFNYITA